MSKKFKGKLCVYCVERPSTTADHVICREFFLPARRNNLPKVPACSHCNGEKSEVEHYLTALLAFGARHPDAAVNLAAMVPKRLNKNAKLYAELAEGFAQSGGQSLPVDHLRLERLFAFITRGLLWHHWNVILDPGNSVIASIFADSGTPFFERMLYRWNTPNRVSGNLGEGTFCYEGAQATDCKEMSVWRFAMYGGIVFGGDPRVPGPSSLAVAVTGPDDLIQKLRSKS